MVTAAQDEAWAEQHWQTLQKLLDEPEHDHGVRGLLPRGDLPALLRTSSKVLELNALDVTTRGTITGSPYSLRMLEERRLPGAARHLFRGTIRILGHGEKNKS